MAAERRLLHRLKRPAPLTLWLLESEIKPTKKPKGTNA